MAYFRRRNLRNETDRSLEFANELEPPKVRNALLVPWEKLVDSTGTDGWTDDRRNRRSIARKVSRRLTVVG